MSMNERREWRAKSNEPGYNTTHFYIYIFYRITVAPAVREGIREFFSFDDSVLIRNALIWYSFVSKITVDKVLLQLALSSVNGFCWLVFGFLIAVLSDKYHNDSSDFAKFVWL